ncbi:Sodium/calcium exchanger protein-domain-containing protein [Fimicolochytrium jonesii]|uniref:Sodium/calcium exchanger protein-domain-containing protein n=1 Tax=Fimicolochytrium jonesii TaxID=1396493 RepID=UPI0022FDC61F|nr:Sodium/calcium exchanger protein-domain-containing protein [Fimicolochytrium jonesii]KAI8817870.1 Sodium/calcium exchanger protein-domain-containing protein [Fimicolochytrium jonesii]
MHRVRGRAQTELGKSFINPLRASFRSSRSSPNTVFSSNSPTTTNTTPSNANHAPTHGADTVIDLDSTDTAGDAARRSQDIGGSKTKTHQPPVEHSILGQMKIALFNSYLNILLVLVPVGIALHFTSVSPTIIFVVNFIAIIPLAGLLCFATEELAGRTGEVFGGLLNATFGNAVELIVAVIALAKREVIVVQTSMVGSILSNLLLVLGCSFLLGGFNRYEQYFNTTVAQSASSLLALAVAALIIPTAFHMTATSAAPNVVNSGIVNLSHATAVILLLVYASYLLFQLKTHALLFQMPSQKVPKRHEIHSVEQLTNLIPSSVASANPNVRAGPARDAPEAAEKEQPDNGVVTREGEANDNADDDDEEDAPQLTVAGSVILLTVVTVAVAFCAEFLVDAIDEVCTSTGISRYFVGLILLPIVGNVRIRYHPSYSAHPRPLETNLGFFVQAAEHVTSITVAIKDKMDLAIGVAIGSSLQVALLIIPLIVILGWIMGIEEMTLFFDGFQVIILLVSVLLVNYLIQDGKSNFLEGNLLISMYLIIAVSAWYFPDTQGAAEAGK